MKKKKRTLYRCLLCDILVVSDCYKFKVHLNSNGHKKKMEPHNDDPETGKHSQNDKVKYRLCNNKEMKYFYYINIHCKTDKHLRHARGETNKDYCKYCDLTTIKYYTDIHNRSKKHLKKKRNMKRIITPLLKIIQIMKLKMNNYILI